MCGLVVGRDIMLIEELPRERARRVRQRRRAGGGEIRSEDEDIIIYSARTRGGREGDGMVGFWDTNNYWDGYLFGFPRGEIFYFLKGTSR